MQARYRCLLSVSPTNAEVARLPLLLFWIILRRHTGICAALGGRCHPETPPGALGDKAQRGHGAGARLAQLLRGTWCQAGDLPFPHHRARADGLSGRRAASPLRQGCTAVPGPAKGPQIWVRDARPGLPSAAARAERQLRPCRAWGTGGRTPARPAAGSPRSAGWAAAGEPQHPLPQVTSAPLGPAPKPEPREPPPLRTESHNPREAPGR